MALVIGTGEETETTRRISTIDVEAISIQDANRIACGILGKSMDVILQTMVVKVPRAASTCSTEDYPVRGTRKWKTVYQVYAYGTRIPVGRDRFDYIGNEIVRDDIETKTEAVKIAREMAIKHQQKMNIQIVQKLESHDPSCADVVPKTTKGVYRITYLLR